VAVTGITLAAGSLAVSAGDIVQLEATLLPEGATNRGVQWSSDNDAAAEVGSDGKVTAVSEGSAVITATTADGGFTATCTVTVTDSVAVTGITFNISTLTLTTGGQGKISCSISPANATNKNVVWQTGNSQVATVDAAGTVTGIAVGSTTITAVTVNGGLSALCTVTVSNDNVAATTVEMNKYGTALLVGATEQLSALVLPVQAVDKSVVWSSNDTEIVTVSDTGLLTGVSAGSTQVKAKLKNGSYYASCSVTVTNTAKPVTGISLAPELLLTPGNTELLEATLTPPDTTNRNINWVSADTGIATVDAGGYVTGVSVGTTEITAETADGGFTAKCTVTVMAVLPTYTVTYHGTDADGGTPPPPQTKLHGVDLGIAGNPGNLYRTGYTLKYWMTLSDENGSYWGYNPGVGTYRNNADLDLYPAWEIITYPVIYNSNGATGGPLLTTQYKKYDVDLTLYTVSGSLKKTGFTFVGWNTASNGSGTDYADGGTYSENKALQLYAKWTPATYMITYDGNGATGGLVPEPATKQYNVGCTVSGPGTLVKSGYVFSGWNTAANGTGAPVAAGSVYTYNADITLYAQWTEQYTITYFGNGSTGGSTPPVQYKLKGTPVTLAANSGLLVRSGYVFVGWNTEANGTGTDYAEGATVTAEGSLQLCAKWAASSYTVTYHANGATSGTIPAAQTKTYGVGLTLALNSGTLSKMYMTFGGWNTAADGTGTTYAPGAVYTANQSVTLYAKWMYPVTYMANGATGGTVPAVQHKLSGIPLTLEGNSGNLVLAGKSFAGWNTNAAGTGTAYAAGATYTVNTPLYLYAQWVVKTYTITYSADEADSGTVPGSQVKTHGVNITLQSKGDLYRKDYVFGGWVGRIGSYSIKFGSGGLYTYDSDVALSALWYPVEE
jgi:uncharacterized repeat protein (TIGR02543 family)